MPVPRDTESAIAWTQAVRIALRRLAAWFHVPSYIGRHGAQCPNMIFGEDTKWNRKDGNGQTTQGLTLVFLETDDAAGGKLLGAPDQPLPVGNVDLVVARGPETGETVEVSGQAPVRPACVSYVLLDEACAAIGIASVHR